MLEISADVVSRRGRGPKYSDRMRRVVDSLKPFALFLETAAKIAMHEVLLVDQKKKRFFFKAARVLRSRHSRILYD